MGANLHLRGQLNREAERHGYRVFYPPLELCTGNGAMIALAGAPRLRAGAGNATTRAFDVRPQWGLEELRPSQGR